MKKLFILAALSLSIGLVACNKNKNGGMTKVNVKLTDAPGAYQALFLSIKEVQIFSSGGQSTLEVNSAPFNILNYTMGKDTLIASEDIPSGTLQEVRLVLNSTGS